MEFSKIAPYLTHPLVLIGLGLFLAFGIHKTLLTSGIIPPLTQSAGSRVVQLLLQYGFLLSVMVIVLGFALQTGQPVLGGALATIILAIIVFIEIQRYRKGGIPDPQEIISHLVQTHESRLREQEEGFLKREGTYQEQVKGLTEAVRALAQQGRTAKYPNTIAQALRELGKGKTKVAEKIFREVLEQKKLRGREALKEAAEAARHLGALAFLHSTDRAIAAYREATELDRDNADGWNQLGTVLQRKGNLDEAQSAFNTVLELGIRSGDKTLQAIGYGNLGNLYATWGDLPQAEAMYRKSLALNEELGRKEGMASDYGNLGILYKTRGDPPQAEVMYRKSLALFQEIGSMTRVVQTQKLLDELKNS